MKRTQSAERNESRKARKGIFLTTRLRFPTLCVCDRILMAVNYLSIARDTESNIKLLTSERLSPANPLRCHISSPLETIKVWLGNNGAASWRWKNLFVMLASRAMESSPSDDPAVAGFIAFPLPWRQSLLLLMWKRWTSSFMQCLCVCVDLHLL